MSSDCLEEASAGNVFHSLHDTCSLQAQPWSTFPWRENPSKVRGSCARGQPLLPCKGASPCWCPQGTLLCKVWVQAVPVFSQSVWHHSWILVSQTLALLGASTAALLCCPAENLIRGAHNIEAAGSVPLPCREGAKTFLKVCLCRNYPNHNERFLHLPLSPLHKKLMP